jgi:hypothetical protein
MAIEAERGYLIVAENTATVDYVECARALARSIKLHTPQAQVCLVTSHEVNDDVFDYVRPLPFGDQAPDSNWKLKNDWQVFYASPFRETIKIEADMIVPHSIWHWWPMLEKRDVVLCTHARNYLNTTTPVRHYRKIFDENKLPDVYNAITYWRYSLGAKQFFDTVRMLFDNWETARTALKFGDEDLGTTDVVYAVAAKMLGVENFTLPDTSYPSLIHMKGQINRLEQEDWTKELVWELDGANIRINTVDQQYPFHYNNKDFAKVLNEHYDKLLGST